MEDKKIRLATKIEIFKYSFGGIGSNVAYSLIMTYLMFFYTDIFGISALSVGTLFMVSRLIDAITDPIMGMIADRTRTKFGRYRPWIIFGAPVLGMMIILLFYTPNIGYNQKIAYAYVTYILYSLVSTVVNIPYHSLTPVMSEDSVQRTQVASAKQIMGIPGSLMVAVATLPIAAAFGGGQQGWFRMSMVFACIVVPAFFLCAAGAKRHDTVDETKPDAKLTVKDQLSVILKNKPLLLLTAAFAIQSLAGSISSSVNMYYMTYNVGRPDMIPIIGLVTVLVTVPVAMFLPSMSKRFDKKRIYIFGNILSAISCLLVFITPVHNVTLVLIAMVLVTGTGQISNIMGWAMLADCVDYAEWKFGIRGDGTISSTHTFINKCGMAFGGLIVGAIMQTVGYIANVPQTSLVLSSILSMKALLPAAAYLVAIFFIAKYPITNERYTQILQEIKERKENEISGCE